MTSVQAQGDSASDHLLSHSNSFGFEMEIDTAGCRAYSRNFIVGGHASGCQTDHSVMGRSFSSLWTDAEKVAFSVVRIAQVG